MISEENLSLCLLKQFIYSKVFKYPNNGLILFLNLRIALSNNVKLSGTKC